MIHLQKLEVWRDGTGQGNARKTDRLDRFVKVTQNRFIKYIILLAKVAPLISYSKGSFTNYYNLCSNVDIWLTPSPPMAVNVVCEWTLRRKSFWRDSVLFWQRRMTMKMKNLKFSKTLYVTSIKNYSIRIYQCPRLDLVECPIFQFYKRSS